MAIITNTLITFSNVSSAVTFTAATGSDYFVPDNADGRVGILIKNSNATQSATVTLKAGDGVLSSLGDIEVTVSASAIVYVPLARAETARVKVTTGTDKGKVFVTTAVDTGGTIGSVGIGIISVE
jgi:hypothetical protein